MVQDRNIHNALVFNLTFPLVDTYWYSQEIQNVLPLPYYFPKN